MEMVEVRTEALTGTALDWAVAKAEGHDAYVDTVADQIARIDRDIFTDHEVERLRAIFKPKVRLDELRPCPAYSTDWSQAGPLIEKHLRSLSDAVEPEAGWEAVGGKQYMAVTHQDRFGFGPTHLIAACRAIVAAKLGDTVQVPAELAR